VTLALTPAAVSAAGGPAGRLSRTSSIVLGLLAAAAVAAIAAGRIEIGFAVFALAAGAALIARPTVCPAVAGALLFANVTGVASSVHGAPGIVSGVLPALLALPVLQRLSHRNPTVVTTPTVVAVLVHFAAYGLTVLTARDVRLAFGEYAAEVVEGLFLFLLLVNALATWRQLRWMLGALVAAAAFLGILSVIQYATETYSQDYGGFAQVSGTRLEQFERGRDVQPRIAGPLGSENRYAQQMEVALAVAIGLAFASRGLRRAAALVAALLSLAAIVLTLSRGAVVGLGVALVALLVVRAVPLRLLIVAGVAAVAAVFLVPGYGERVESSSAGFDVLANEQSTAEADRAIESRLTQNLAALHMFDDSPFVGVGPGGYNKLYVQYAQRVGFYVHVGATREPHSLYLGMLAEQGVVGTGTFLAVVGVVLFRLNRLRITARSHRRDDIAAVVAGVFGGIAAYLGAGIFLHLAYARYWWFFVALAELANILGRRELHQLELEPALDSPSTSATIARTARPEASHENHRDT
jgi:putative inorganic carbon (hco3(-)) transporter